MNLTPDQLKMLQSLPPGVRASIEQQQAAVQRDMFALLAKSAKGETKFSRQTFKAVKDLHAFLNNNKSRILSWQVVPDFETYSYVLIYEETVQ